MIYVTKIKAGVSQITAHSILTMRFHSVLDTMASRWVIQPIRVQDSTYLSLSRINIQEVFQGLCSICSTNMWRFFLPESMKIRSQRVLFLICSPNAIIYFRVLYRSEWCWPRFSIEMFTFFKNSKLYKTCIAILLIRSMESPWNLFCFMNS